MTRFSRSYGASGGVYHLSYYHTAVPVGTEQRTTGWPNQSRPGGMAVW